MLRPGFQPWWRRWLAPQPANPLARQQRTRICPECRAQYEPRDRYCPGCHMATPEWRYG